MARIALRYLWARRFRTFLTSLAIVLGVMMVTGTYVLTDTIDRSFEDIFTESNEGIDAIVATREAVETDDGQVPPFPESVLRKVQATDGVAAAEGGIGDPQVSIIGTDGEPLGGNGAPSFGFSTGSARFDPLTYEGEKPAADDELVIDRQSAESEGYEIGDTVPIAGKEAASEYTLVGIATLGEVDSFGGASFAVLTLPEAQRITGKEGQLDQVTAAAAEGLSPEELVRNLSEALPRTVEAQTGAENTQDQQDDVGEFIGFLTTFLLIFAGVALFVAAFLIFNTFSITLAQRTREFGMLRTLGANRRQIIGSVVLEAVVIGLGASLLGFALGVLFADVLESLFQALGIDLPASGRVIEARTVIVALVVGTLLAVLAALIPAVRATRVPPVAALREGAVRESRSGSRRRSAIGVILSVAGIALMLLGLFGTLDPGEAWVGAGAAAVFLGITLLSPRLVRPLASAIGRPLERIRGLPGRLARENAIRNPGRTASTAAALMIGLALVSFVAVFAAGLRASIDSAIDKVFASDLILANTDGFSDIPERSGDAIRSIEGVETVSPYRFTEAKVKGAGDGFLSLVDPETVGAVLELDWTDGSSETLSGLGPTDAAIDEKWGTENGFAVGEKFEATTASGETITYTVRGTYKDNADFTGDYVASDANAAAYGEASSVTNQLIAFSDDADGDAVRGEIDAVIEARLPDHREPGPAGAEGLDRGAAQHPARRRVRAPAPGGDRLPVRDRQHARPLDLRADPGAGPAARCRDVAAPNEADRPLRGGDHRPDRRRARDRPRRRLRDHRQPSPGRRGLRARDPNRYARHPDGARRDRRDHRRDRPCPARLTPRRARSARLRVMADRPEPPPTPPLPARLLGRGARGVGRVAGATGLDRAAEEAIADAVVRTIESPAFERALAEVFDGPAVENAVERAMQSPAVERALSEAIDSEMVDRLWERLLASDEAQKLVERIAEAPEVRAAIAQQGVGLIADLGHEIGQVARKLDDVLERIIRRLTFRKPREEPTEQAGLVSRGLAALIDGVILNLGVLGASALFAFLINALSDGSGDAPAPVFFLGASAWALAGAAYLVAFWTFEGETPGMRFLDINLEAGGRPRLGFTSSLRRLFWLVISFVPLLGLPLLGIARRDDRRGLHDRRAGTSVVYVNPGTRAAPWTRPGQNENSALDAGTEGSDPV